MIILVGSINREFFLGGSNRGEGRGRMQMMDNIKVVRRYKTMRRLLKEIMAWRAYFFERPAQGQMIVNCLH